MEKLPAHVRYFEGFSKDGRLAAIAPPPARGRILSVSRSIGRERLGIRKRFAPL